MSVSVSQKSLSSSISSMVLSNQFANNSINKKAFICKGKYLKSKIPKQRKNRQQSHFKYNKYIRQAGAICLSVNLPIFCCITINHEYYLVSGTPPVCYLINYLHLTPFLPPLTFTGPMNIVQQGQIVNVDQVKVRPTTQK